MDDLPVRVAWWPRAWARAAARHPELAAGGRQPWLAAAVTRHVELGPRSRSALAAALRADGLLGGRGSPRITEYRLPAPVVAALDAALEEDARAGPATGRSEFVQRAALTAVEAEHLR